MAKKKASKTQVSDQIAKGGIMALVVYFANKGDIDPELLAICMPLIAGVMAWVSTKIGDPAVASFFDAAKKVSAAAIADAVPAVKAVQEAVAAPAAEVTPAMAPAKKSPGRPKKAAPKK